MRNLEKLIEFLETENNCKVFYLDIRKDDIEENQSFFIYNDKGEITQGHGLTYVRNFYLHFITRDGSEIDEISIIDFAKKNCSMFFDRTEIEFGKIQNLDESAKMTTFMFTYNTPCRNKY